MADLVTLAAVKTALGITGTGRDGEITRAIADASALIEARCEREFTPTASATRTVAVASDGWVDLAPYDLRTLTTLTLDPDGTPQVVAAANIELHPFPARFGVYTTLEITATLPRITGRLVAEIEGAWGFEEVPEPVERACIETVRTMISRDSGNWAQVADTSGAPDYAGSQGTYAIPKSALSWLDPYRRPVGTWA